MTAPLIPNTPPRDTQEVAPAPVHEKLHLLALLPPPQRRGLATVVRLGGLGMLVEFSLFC
jgi:hypothetical protein